MTLLKSSKNHTMVINTWIIKSGVAEFFHSKIVIPAPAFAGAGCSVNPEIFYVWSPACARTMLDARLARAYR